MLDIGTEVLEHFVRDCKLKHDGLSNDVPDEVIDVDVSQIKKIH